MLPVPLLGCGYRVSNIDDSGWATVVLIDREGRLMMGWQGQETGFVVSSGVAMRGVLLDLGLPLG